MAEPIEDAVPIGPLMDWLKARGHGGRATLAKKLGVTPQVITNWISRKAVPGARLAAVARAMGVTMDDYMAGAAEPKLQDASLRTGPVKNVTLRETPAAYGSVNVEILAFVLVGVDKELPDAKPEERAAIAAFAYHHMLIVGTKDEQALAGFFRGYWASRGKPARFDPTSPEVLGRPGQKSKVEK